MKYYDLIKNLIFFETLTIEETALGKNLVTASNKFNSAYLVKF